jgi:hypothetical protein
MRKSEDVFFCLGRKEYVVLVSLLTDWAIAPTTLVVVYVMDVYGDGGT